MNRRIRFSRRIFIKSLAGAMIAGPAALVSGCQDSNAVDRRLQFLSLSAAMDEAERLARATDLETGLSWTLSQTLVHCAQSIEFSMTGFPEMKPEIFRHTVGTVAFSVFAWRGRMSHDLSEPIPGAPSLADENDLAAALTRLRRSIDDFEATREPMQPHFAYGRLSKPDYEIAHTMHLANHFSVIDA